MGNKSKALHCSACGGKTHHIWNGKRWRCVGCMKREWKAQK